MVFEFPQFAAAAATVSGRIHDDRLVAAAALEFAADELEAVVDNVTDGSGGQAGKHNVFAAPLDHALGGVDMADTRTGSGGGAGGGAGVAEKVEHANRPAGLADFLRAPLPVDCLLGEKAGVLKAGGADFKREVKRGVADVPVLGQRPSELPAASAALAALVKSVPIFPRRTRCLAAPRPEDLRVGPHEHVGPPSLLF